MLPTKRTRWLCLPLLMLLPALLLASACGNQGPGNSGPQNSGPELPISNSYFIFNTLVSVRVYDERMEQSHFDKIEQLMEDIDAKMNRQRPGSEIDLVNQQAGNGAVQVSPDTFNVLRTAMDYAASSAGRFDPSVGPLSDLWGIGSEDAAIPKTAALQEALALVGYRHVKLSPDHYRVELLRPGMSLDFGAIAKGYAADVIKAYLQEQGFNSAIIDLGGNIIAMGDKPDGSAWSIGIQDPAKKRGNHLGLLKVRDKTIVTSGIYERFFEEDGVVYHHLLDTSTGYPISNGLLSMTIVTDISMDADAMSTAAFALGLEAGLQYVEAMGNAEAIFVTVDKEVFVTSGLQGQFELTNGGYQFGN